MALKLLSNFSPNDENEADACGAGDAKESQSQASKQDVNFEFDPEKDDHLVACKLKYSFSVF